MQKIIASTYETLRTLGSGGGGIVYLARHLRLDKLVVLKADKRGISPELEELMRNRYGSEPPLGESEGAKELRRGAEAIEKFRREINALKNLSHTYIPQVFDFFPFEGTVYTVVDYIEGESLDKPLSRGESFPQPSVVKWTRQLLEALAYLHGRPPHGILHADIKPANVMLNTQGDICLIDFNIALALGEEGAVSVGRSFGYASPEHLGIDYSASASTVVTRYTSSETSFESSADTSAPDTRFVPGESRGSRSGSTPILLDARSDIYGLGATLYHLMTGKRPARDAKDVEPIPTGVFSPAFVAVVNKAMNPNPDLRYRSAQEMLSAVNDLYKNDPRYRRHMRSRITAAVLLSVVFLSGGFASFAGLKRMERTQNALALSGYSAKSLDEGDVASALSYALSALPTGNDIFTPPAAAQAREALANALGVYDLKDGYTPVGTLNLPSSPFLVACSPSGEFAAAVYAGEAAVFTPESAQIIARLPAARSALADIEFLNESILLYAGRDSVCAYDALRNETLWQGKPATEIAVSADGATVAAVYKDEGEAAIYDAEGNIKGVVSFCGKKQRVPVNDGFANPGDILLALNRDGSLLAASFSDGSLDLFDLANGDVIAVRPPSGATHFEGGFSGDTFAFSSAGAGEACVFEAYDTRTLTRTGGFTAEEPFGCIADERGVYVSAQNLVVKIDPKTGEQKEAAYLEKAVAAYSHNGGDFIASGQDNSFNIFNPHAQLIDRFIGDTLYDFVAIGGDYALAASRSAPEVRIVKREDYSAADVFHYDPAYLHDEARINGDHSRVTLFSYRGFRLFDADGTTLCETEIPDADYVYDQQYAPVSGNLAVLYRDALRVYSGADGSLLFEETGLLSTFYAPYGVSVFGKDGVVRLIDIETATETARANAGGTFAAFCGMVVDDAFLGERGLIGAGKVGGKIFFAVSDGASGSLYDESGKAILTFVANGKAEAFFADDVLIVSPLHGTPAAYSVKTGKKLRDLATDAYMTYAYPTENGLICEYVSANGERFGLLLDANCETVARLPNLSDGSGNRLLFDYHTGVLRQTHVRSLDELITVAKGGTPYE